MTIKMIVGLANPGTKYAATRHNIGSWYIKILAKRLNSPLKKDKNFYGITSCINLAGACVRLLIPTTFINLSGKSVLAMASFYRINPNEILVAHDELDLPPGVAKFKSGGSNNTNNIHKGLKNIINELGNNSNFYRLRFGIGHPGNKNKVINFVLSNPTFTEQKLIQEAVNEAVYCTEIWFKEGLAKATNRLHAFKAQ